MIWVFFLSVLYTAMCQVPTDLADGNTIESQFDTAEGGSTMYRFRIRDEDFASEKDLAVILTTFTDWEDPDMYMSPGQRPSVGDYEYKSDMFGMGSIIVPSYEVEAQDYFILVLCRSVCRYSITISYQQERQLQDGRAQSNVMEANSVEVYQFEMPAGQQEYLEFTVTPSLGSVLLYVHEAPEEPTTDNSAPTKETFTGGQTCVIYQPRANMYRAAVMTTNSTATYNIIARTSVGVEELQASVPTHGSVTVGHYRHYKFHVPVTDATLEFQLTPYAGDSDIYVDVGKQPTKEDYKFKSAHTDIDVLKLNSTVRADTSESWYYVSVYGFTQSIFTLVAKLAQGVVRLLPGVDAFGSALENEISYYSIDLPNGSDFNVTISINVESGNPDLYARLCTSDDCQLSLDDIEHIDVNPGIEYSAHKTGADIIQIPHTSSKCTDTARCQYLIAVNGNSPNKSVFVISASYIESSERTLRENHSVIGTVNRDGYTFFKYHVINTTTTDVNFILTPLQGDADLYVNRTGHPSALYYEKASHTEGSDSVMYVRGETSDLSDLTGIYHIAVYGRTLSTFSIVANESHPSRNTTIRLLPGHPQKDTLWNEPSRQYRIFRFDVHQAEEHEQPLTVTLTGLEGEFRMFIANALENLNLEHDSFFYQWCDCNETHTADEVILIDPSDENYVREGSYLILVKATSFLSDGRATYTMTYNSGDNAINLSEGLAFNDHVELDRYNTYTFPVLNNTIGDTDVTIILTTFSGDSDLYVSFKNPKPDKENYEYKATQYGSEKLTITWEDGIKKEWPTFQKEYNFGEKTYCMLYIAVLGNTESNYSIQVFTRMDIPRQVSPGIPQYGEATRGQTSYFYSIVSNNEDLMISLTSLNGDADLLVNVWDREEAGSRREEWDRPRIGNSQYESLNPIVAERIDVGKTIMIDACPSGICVAIAGAYCQSEDCQFSMLMLQGHVTTLQEGMPTQGSVNSEQYSYYKFHNRKERSKISINITKLSEGDLNMYITKRSDTGGDTNRPMRLPTTFDYDWTGDASIVIEPEDEYFAQPGKHSVKGTYVIAVKGQMPVGFSITVTTEEYPIMRLLNGQPQSASSLPAKPTYFFYNSHINSQVKLTVTPLKGNGFVAITVADMYADNLTNSLPTIDQNYWSSATENEQYLFTIDQNDQHFCHHCNYVIGVFAITDEFKYNIVGINEYYQIQLVNGVPNYPGPLMTGQMHYYLYEIVNQQSFTVALMTYTGDADLYIGLEPVVAPDNCKWISLTNSTVEYISIDALDPDYRPGLYYIGVYGIYDNTEYSITAHTKNSLITLVDGWPQRYEINLRQQSDRFMYFSYQQAISARNTTCSVMSMTKGYEPVVFVYEGFKINPGNPGFLDKFDNSLFDELTFDLPLIKETNKYTLAVTYGRNSTAEYGEFQLSCNWVNEDTIDILTPYLREFGNIEESDSYKRYSISINETSTMKISVVPCEGQVEILVSRNNTSIDQSKNGLVVNKLSDGQLQGQIMEAIGKYYITVHTLNEKTAARFQIEAGVYGDEATIHNPSPGHEGLIKTTTYHRKIDVSWKAANLDGLEVEDASIMYGVFYTKEKMDENMLTTCGIYTGVEQNMINSLFYKRIPISEQPAEFEMSLDDIDSDASYLINVVCKIETPKQRWELVYRPTTVSYTDGHGSQGRWKLYAIIAFFSFGCIAAVIVACCYYFKYHRTESRLRYEMNDVRNVAGIEIQDLPPAGSEGKQKKKANYTHLDESIV